MKTEKNDFKFTIQKFTSYLKNKKKKKIKNSHIKINNKIDDLKSNFSY